MPLPINAPLPPTPAPLIVNASAPIATLLMFNVAPDATVVPAVVAPRPAAFVTDTVPALMVVAPVYVLAPDSVSVPVPCLISAPEPAITSPAF